MIRFDGMSIAGPNERLDILACVWPDKAMKRVGVAELKNGLSRHLRDVEGGAILEITDHDRPIARLVPIEAKSRLVMRKPLRPFSEIAHTRYPPLHLPINSTELLREDRDAR